MLEDRPGPSQPAPPELAEQLARTLPRLGEARARELAQVVERLVAVLRPERIYAFGSQARGTATSDSDVDLLVVVPESDLLPHRRDQEALLAIGRHWLPLDVLVLTRAEFERKRHVPASLPGTALREGKVVYSAAADAEQVSAAGRSVSRMERPYMRPEFLGEAREWLARAELDLRAVERLLAATPLTGAAAFHAQQAVEKALKGYLAAQGLAVPKTHDLGPLAEQCAQIDPSFAPYVAVLPVLSPYAVRFRYAGGALEPSPEQAAEAQRLAESIVQLVRARLSP